MVNEVRDVRTLLLCRVHNDHSKAYREICGLKTEATDMRSFFTVGGFDALTIYKPNISSTSPEWMDALREDKRSVFQNMSTDVSYHPLHIVANTENQAMRREKLEQFWSESTKKEYPFLLITLVYGANHSVQKPYEDYLWEYLSERENGMCRFAVYNSVNLCDLVILWYTKDISASLNEILSVSLLGQARKTYTFVNIPLSDGQFDNNAENNLLAHSDPFPICICGSIRNSELFYKYIHDPLMIKTESAPALFPNSEERCTRYGKPECRISYGENDFLITGWINGEEFWKLMKYFLKASVDIDKACWSIFTEFQQLFPNRYESLLGKEPLGKKTSRLPPNHILAKEYERFLAVHNNLSEYPWADAFLELISIHAHMDELPILHGPSYLLWGCLNIANQYFRGEVPEYSKSGFKLKYMLNQSQYSIDRFVREWSQLTDQITKVDDVVFYRMGSTASIYSTVSESILEMYHLFLSWFSSALLRADQISSSAVFSFLLVPTLNQQMRISRMFYVHADMPRDKQVYIIEFPRDYAYMPSLFAVQLAHECLHIFGDALRLRPQRFAKMICYMAFDLISVFPDVMHQENLANTLCETIFTELQDFIGGTSTFYLAPVVEALKETIANDILTQQTYALLCRSVETQEEATIYRGDDIDAWIALEGNFDRKGYARTGNISIEEKIEQCAYYFKECYADAMAIKLLGVTVREYLKAFQLEASFISDCHGVEGVHLTQRLAIVLTACLEEGVFSKTDNDVLNGIRHELDQIYPNTLADMIISCISALLGDNIDPPSQRDWPPLGNHFCASRNALICVVDYLRETLFAIGQNIMLSNMESTGNPFCEVRKLYKDIIQSGSFFSKQYYKYILDYHKDISSRVKESKMDNISDHEGDI